METRRDRSPTLVIVVVTVVAMVLGAAFLALKEGRLGGPDSTAGARSDAAPKASVCFRCGVIESIRSIDKAELAKASAVAIRGFGDDLMSVLAVVAGALTGNRPWESADGTPLHEITVRFEDGTSRVFNTLDGRKWERGDRVKVVQGRIHTQPATPSTLSFDTTR